MAIVVRLAAANDGGKAEGWKQPRQSSSSVFVTMAIHLAEEKK